MNHTSRTGLYIMVIIILISCLHTCDIVESIDSRVAKLEQKK